MGLFYRGDSGVGKDPLTLPAVSVDKLSGQVEALAVDETPKAFSVDGQELGGSHGLRGENGEKAKLMGYESHPGV